MGRVTLILLFFVPYSHIAKQNPKIPIQIEITLKRNFTFNQLIDKNVYVRDNGRSARVIAPCTGWVGKLRVGIVEET